MGRADPEHVEVQAKRARKGARAGAIDGARAVPGAAGAGLEALVAKSGAYLAAQLRAEAGPGVLFPWIAVAFGCGIALYFSASAEPSVAVSTAFALLVGLGAFAARGKAGAFAVLALLAALACGFAAANLRTAIVAHDVLKQPLFGAKVTGTVLSREVRERSDRVVLAVESIDAGRSQTNVARVRLAFRKGQGPAVGSRVAVKARLSSPQMPARPGGYDFSRDLYFQGIAASGFVLGKPEILSPNASPGWRLATAAWLQNIRDTVDARIGVAVGGDARAIASALITGRRDALSAPVNDAMFISGLGHVLSISGYHMAVVAGLVFFIVRLGLALVPGLADRAPIKTWAAFVALGASAFYLVLSGSEVATQRSFVMTAIVLAGIMLDRRAITFRTLALAALLVLALAPESLVHPSFQMSFAATLAIVALVAQGMPALFDARGGALAARAAGWGAREVTALILVSLVAGLATTPAVAFHFHRFTPYGAIANLLAMPVVSLWVMPAGILGLVTIPFGLDFIFWRVMEGGILWMNAVAQWVSSLPGAIGPVHAFGTGPLLLASLGTILMCLLRSHLRWLGVPLIVMACVAVWLAPQPHILIAQDGRAMALRGGDGKLRVISERRNNFQLREWLASDADTRPLNSAALQAGVRCDAGACNGELAAFGTVALVMRVEAFDEDCKRAQLIISRLRAPKDCAALTIGPDELTQMGALALYRDGEGFRVEASQTSGVIRPWTSAANGEAASRQGTDVRLTITHGKLAHAASSDTQAQPAPTIAPDGEPDDVAPGTDSEDATSSDQPD